MPSSETARAIIFVSLALVGCLIRTYIRTANGEKEDEVHFWSSRFSHQQEADAAFTHKSISPLARLNTTTDTIRPHSNTSSGQVSQAVSVVHDRPPQFPPFSPGAWSRLESSTLAERFDGSEVDEAYEDWAAMHHARGAVSEDAEASIDHLLQTRQLQKSLHMQKLAQVEHLGSSGASTPTIWTAQFPAAQLRPY